MKKIGIYVFVGLFLIIAFKSCIVTSISIDDYILLESVNEEGQHDKVILTPKEEMIYFKTYQGTTEVGIYKIKGIEASHYFAGLYNVGTFPFGLRYYNNPDMVFDTELKLIKKQGESFPEVGDSYRTKMVIFKNKAEIGNHSYTRVVMNLEDKTTIESMVDQIKNNLN